jgi:hypothetical protein
MADAAANMNTLRRVYNAIRAETITEKVLADAATGLKFLAGRYGNQDWGTMPNVTVIDIPMAGLGVEVSIYSNSMTFSVETLYESDRSILE